MIYVTCNGIKLRLINLEVNSTGYTIYYLFMNYYEN